VARRFGIGRVCQVVEKFSRVSIRRDDVTTLLPFHLLQVSTAIKHPQFNLPAVQQAEEQQHHRVLSWETRLRLRAAAELLVDALERVGRPKRLPTATEESAET
jgi:hypothetical protein